MNNVEDYTYRVKTWDIIVWKCYAKDKENIDRTVK